MSRALADKAADVLSMQQAITDLTMELRVKQEQFLQEHIQELVDLGCVTVNWRKARHRS